MSASTTPPRRPVILTDLQIDIMRVLWSRGSATVVDVHAALSGERKLAQATVATLLTRLEKKGALNHTVQGRQFVYRPRIKEAEIKRTMIAQLRDSLFTGDVPALVNQLLSDREISSEDLDKVKRLIAEKERELADRAAKTNRKRST